MKLIIREYLLMLRESGEFDQLLVDLLPAMGYVPISKPQRGVRQDGVDIAAVGALNGGRQELLLFVVKRGNIGRTDWNDGAQSVRQSLDEVRDVYLRSHVAPEHQTLPKKIVICMTGDLLQEADTNLKGYVQNNAIVGGLEYETWNGDKVAGLVEEYLLNEYLLPGITRAQLRRSIALVGESDYDLEHFYGVLQNLLLDDPFAGSESATAKKVRIRKSLRTAAVCVSILFHWAQEAQYLRNALLAVERSILWGWDAIRRHDFLGDKALNAEYFRLIALHATIGVAYVNKIQPRCFVEDGLAEYSRESALLAEVLFEQIGIIATVSISQVFLFRASGDQKHMDSACACADMIQAVVENNAMALSPCYDGQVIDVVLALIQFTETGRNDVAKAWIREMAGRVRFAYMKGTHFPISTENFDDLLILSVDGAPDHESRKKLNGMSWLIPTLAQWAIALGDDDLYTIIASWQKDVLKDTCLQLWYPDSETDAILYRQTATFDSGTTEAPIELPIQPAEMRRQISLLYEGQHFTRLKDLSAVATGVPQAVLIANRHFRTPVHPEVWQSQMLQALPPQSP